MISPVDKFGIEMVSYWHQCQFQPSSQLVFMVPKCPVPKCLVPKCLVPECLVPNCPWTSSWHHWCQTSSQLVPVSSILQVTGAGLRWLRSVPLIPSPQQHHAALQVPASIFIDNQLMLLLIVVNKTHHPHLQMKNKTYWP